MGMATTQTINRFRDANFEKSQPHSKSTACKAEFIITCKKGTN